MSESLGCSLSKKQCDLCVFMVINETFWLNNVNSSGGGYRHIPGVQHQCPYCWRPCGFRHWHWNINCPLSPNRDYDNLCPPHLQKRKKIKTYCIFVLRKMSIQKLDIYHRCASELVYNMIIDFLPAVWIKIPSGSKPCQCVRTACIPILHC